MPEIVFFACCLSLIMHWFINPTEKWICYKRKDLLFGYTDFPVSTFIQHILGERPRFWDISAVAFFRVFSTGKYYFYEKVRITIPLWAKIILGIFIIWAALGVGELFDKIDLMMVNL